MQMRPMDDYGVHSHDWYEGRAMAYTAMVHAGMDYRSMIHTVFVHTVTVFYIHGLYSVYSDCLHSDI